MVYKSVVRLNPPPLPVLLHLASATDDNLADQIPPSPPPGVEFA